MIKGGVKGNVVKRVTLLCFLLGEGEMSGYLLSSLTQDIFIPPPPLINIFLYVFDAPTLKYCKYLKLRPRYLGF